MLAVDGTEPGELRKMMEMEMEKQFEHEDNIPKVFESAGGFSPTIGIIGAILGLIQVMQHLDNIDEVGRGIAVAFVATVYGVGAANLLLLPAAGKLRIRIREEQIVREMMPDAILTVGPLFHGNAQFLTTYPVLIAGASPRSDTRRLIRPVTAATLLSTQLPPSIQPPGPIRCDLDPG